MRKSDLIRDISRVLRRRPSKSERRKYRVLTHDVRLWQEENRDSLNKTDPILILGCPIRYGATIRLQSDAALLKGADFDTTRLTYKL